MGTPTPRKPPPTRTPNPYLIEKSLLNETGTSRPSAEVVLVATQVTVEAKEQPGQSQHQRRGIDLPWDAQDRLERLNGVTAAGTTSEVNTGETLMRSVPVNDPSGWTEFQIPLIAASPQLFEAAQSQLLAGRFFDQGHDDRGDAVAVIGSGAAERLNITRVDNTPTIFIGEEPLTIVGIIDSTRREPALLNAVIIPNQHAEQRYGLASPTKLVMYESLVVV